MTWRRAFPFGGNAAFLCGELVLGVMLLIEVTAVGAHCWFSCNDKGELLYLGIFVREVESFIIVARYYLARSTTCCTETAPARAVVL